ncbi:hypothetical protein GCM10022287_20810 [Gryllotalpicola koreensis]|uniref:Uncharacterized protein n=1 Tax=Gryllotalpicola koreensis TaxID=993086 RepID=A0ABP8A1J1_9MICO
MGASIVWLDTDNPPWLCEQMLRRIRLLRPQSMVRAPATVSKATLIYLDIKTNRMPGTGASYNQFRFRNQKYRPKPRTNISSTAKG